MEPDFWHERWDRGQTAFDQAEVHPALAQHWAAHVAGDGDVFVPLCGKSIDMEWLAAQGHRVIGSELSPLAVTEFFASREIDTDTRAEGASTVHVGGDYELWCGDFFAMEQGTLGDVIAVYDRASLVALPPEMRRRYVDHLYAVLPESATVFLLAFEYDQAEMGGPPFSVTPEEIANLFGRSYHIDEVDRVDVAARNPDLIDRGLSGLDETLTILRHR